MPEKKVKTMNELLAGNRNCRDCHDSVLAQGCLCGQYLFDCQTVYYSSQVEHSSQCAFCEGCRHCHLCFHCETCYSCVNCEFCRQCFFCLGLSHERLQIFSHNSPGQEYVAFDRPVSQKRFWEILDEVQAILENRPCDGRFAFDTISKSEWAQLADIPEAQGFDSVLYQMFFLEMSLGEKEICQ